MSDGESFSKKVIQGSVWIFSLRIINRGLGFIRTIILAKLLSPDDFGLLGIAMLAISTLETFTETGFQTALVQTDEKVDTYLDSVWTVSAIRGILLFSIIFFSAPLIAKFFNSPDAIFVIKVIALSSFISGFRNIGVVLFQKDLEFGKQFVYELSGTFVNLLVSISVAFILRNIWALVWGGLAAHCVQLILSFIIHPYHPRFKLDPNKIKSLLPFGKWIFGSSIVTFLVTNGDDIFVGKILGTTALGLYQMAFLISNLSATEVALVVSRVTFPVYSKIQKDSQRLSSAYSDVLQIVAFLSILIAGGIFILAPEFTKIFLSEKWLPMVPAMQVFALASVARSIVATTSPVFSAIGRPDLGTKFQTLRLILLVMLIYPFTLHWGLTGASWAVFLSLWMSSFGFISMAIRTTRSSILHIGRAIIFPVVNMTVVFGVALYFKEIIPPENLTTFLIFMVAIGCAYFLIACILDRIFKCGLVNIVRRSILDV